MDFSEKALNTAAGVFAREKLNGKFLKGDIRDPGPADFDLVFNAGVLERYTADEQSALLRAMASRSRRYVLALVPNAQCYWYWLSRTQRTSSGDSAAGKGSSANRFSGPVPVGWSSVLRTGLSGREIESDSAIQSLPGMDGELRARISRASSPGGCAPRAE